MTTGPFHRVLVGWDASPAARAALTTALALAAGGGTVIARAVLLPPEHTETSGEDRRDVSVRRERLAEQFAATMRTAGEQGARVRLEWGEDADVPGDLAAGAAGHGCDLIVVGRHGSDGRLRVAGLGPVARALARYEGLPVLLVGGPPQE